MFKLSEIASRTALSAAVATALATSAVAPSVAQAEDGEEGQYLSGDFHNHTTCSDGSTSVRTLTRESLTYLDWFIQVGHSGSGSRDCRISDFLYLNRNSSFNRGLWVNSIGPEGIKGDLVEETMGDGVAVQRMWRWQSLQEFQLDDIIEARELPGNEDKEAFLGLEWVVPGHEHSSNTISTGQYDAIDPNSAAMAQFEYCFGRNADDTSGGAGQGWTCEISEENNNKLITLFDGRPEEGIADYNSTLVGGINTDDSGDHVKSVAAVLWAQENFPGDAVSVQAHIERQGAFIEDDDEGFNVEHLRDAHTMAPDISFGMETQPGHQPAYDRGTYAARRPSSGLWTFGGTGCYGAAEAARPGLDFDGNPLDPAEVAALGVTTSDLRKVTICRPGIRTMWDAMLSEGRRFWFFASSDWHNRGAFGPLDFESTLDFYPGEYQEHFSYVIDRPERDPAQDIIDSLRSGNSFAVQGQLITSKFKFEACASKRCATMGETLQVRDGQLVTVRLRMVDPDGENNSPYKFDNPSLKQIGLDVPISEPVLAQVDLIAGAVDEFIEPTDPEYYNPLAPETTRIEKSWIGSELGRSRNGSISLTYRFRAEGDSYIRARGSNIPAGTPNERDMDGNPLPDNLSDNIPCDDAACPPHIAGVLDADVEAWSDIWFYANPIFIEVTGDGRGK
ncbi:MAG: hypothetical protein AAFR91_00435 [Pseudomonadota bacterium]